MIEIELTNRQSGNRIAIPGTTGTYQIVFENGAVVTIENVFVFPPQVGSNGSTIVGFERKEGGGENEYEQFPVVAKPHIAHDNSRGRYLINQGIEYIVRISDD